jgi:hypothetical protein
VAVCFLSFIIGTQFAAEPLRDAAAEDALGRFGIRVLFAREFDANGGEWERIIETLAGFNRGLLATAGDAWTAVFRAVVNGSTHSGSLVIDALGMTGAGSA